jgi:hypothetical protein
MEKQRVTLSKDLPDGRVPVSASSEKKSYHKYCLERFVDIPSEQKQALRAPRYNCASICQGGPHSARLVSWLDSRSGRAIANGSSTARLLGFRRSAGRILDEARRE